MPLTNVNELVENEPHTPHPAVIPTWVSPGVLGWIVGPKVHADWVNVVPVAFFT